MIGKKCLGGPPPTRSCLRDCAQPQVRAREHCPTTVRSGCIHDEYTTSSPGTLEAHSTTVSSGLTQTKSGDVELEHAAMDTREPKQQLAWFHPPKTGTSFGAILAHAANASLPDCARMSHCTSDRSAPFRKQFALRHPYTEHRCYRTADHFMSRFPPATWFRDTAFWPDADDDWGNHQIVTRGAFAAFEGSFYGLFRPPSALVPSNYFRMLDFPIGSPQACLRSLGVRVTAEHTAATLHNMSNVTGREAFLAYARHRTAHVTLMLAGQQVAGWSACPTKHQPRPQLSVALQRLKGFRFVGLTDEWELSICLFHLMHGKRPCKSGEFVNTRPSAAAVDARLARELLLREPSPLSGAADEILFLAARERFWEDARAWNLSSRVCTDLRCTKESAAVGPRCGTRS